MHFKVINFQENVLSQTFQIHDLIQFHTLNVHGTSTFSGRKTLKFIYAI